MASTQAALRSVMAPIGRMGGAGIAAGIIAPIAAIGAAGVKAATDAAAAFGPFETTLVEMQTLAGESAESVLGLSAAVLDLAGPLATGPQELADTLQFIASSGFSGADALDVLTASAKASAVGMGDLHSIADAVTSAVNAWGEDTLTAAEATDVLLRAVRAGKADPDELAQSMGRVTGIAADMGVEFHEVAAAVAAMSLTGLDASEAVTSLRAILTGLLNPTKQAADTLGALGLNAADLRSTLADDRQGLRTVLFDLAEAFGTNEEAAGAVFGNVRALAGVLNLTGAQAETTKSVFDELATGIYSVDEALEVVAGTNAHRRAAALAEIQAAIVGEGSEAAEAITGMYERLAVLLPEILPELIRVGEAVLRPIEGVLGWLADMQQATTNARLEMLGLADTTWQVPEAFAGISEQGEAAARVFADIGTEADYTSDELTALFESLAGSFSSYGMGDPTGIAHTLDMLGISFADFVELAQQGEHSINSLTGALVRMSDEDVPLPRVFGLKTWADAIWEGTQAALEPPPFDWTKFRDPIFGLANDFETNLTPAIEESIGNLYEFGGLVTGIPSPSGEVIGGWDSFKDLLGDTTLQAQDLSTKLLEITDPGFAAANAVEAFNAQYGEIMSDGVMTDDERASLLRPFLEVQARIDELDPEHASAFAGIVGEAWKTLGGDTTDLFGEGGVFPLAIDEAGQVTATIGDQIATNSSGWGPIFGGVMESELDVGLRNVKDYLGIESPSGLWASEVGYQIPAGVAQGIRRGAHLVNAAMDDLKTRLAPPATGTTGTGTGSRGGGGGGGVHMNMVVNNPVAEPASTSLQRAGTQALVMLRMARPGPN